jgi:hypothetical protein
MCSLYGITKGQQAIRGLAGAMRDLTGNMPMLPGVFPDYSAPIVRNTSDGVRELAMARWGMPSPVFALSAGIPTWASPTSATSNRPFTSFAAAKIGPAPSVPGRRASRIRHNGCEFPEGPGRRTPPPRRSVACVPGP